MSEPDLRYAPKGRVIAAAEVQKIREADAYLAAAKAAREGVEAELAERRAKAHAEAVQEGTAACAAAAAEALARAEVEGLARLAALEEDMGPLLVDIVGKVIGQAPREETLQAATKTALEHLREHRASVIRVASDVAGPVEAAVAEVAKETQTDPIRVEIDSRFEPGRCVFSSDRGYVEIGLPALLDAALKPFKEAGHEPG